MKKTEFLKELEESLRGEIPAAAVSDNLRYYDNYISQETEKGRSEAEVIEEIGSPRLIAKTIIDSGSFSAGNSAGGSQSYDSGYESGQRETTSGGYGEFHYVNLSKWYWKLLIVAVLLIVLFTVLSIVGGIFAILFRFATPILLILLIWSLIRNFRR